MDLDLAEIRSELDSQDWLSQEDGDDLERSIWLGTRYALLPSGKMYAPWASSNVTDKEVIEDAEYFEVLQEAIESIGAFLDVSENGEDFYAVEIMTVPVVT